ncbi:hypothetical protein D9O50_12390 [Oxalobacteraceae bacterium CAVE-383]|nr:hypothetical protein D9O50_12390 [Oxalobacteraceae bacterium CAVE-383]
MRSTADRYLPVAGTEQEDIRKYDFNQAFFVVELKRQTRIALEDATNDHAPKQGDLPQDAEARQAFVNNVSSAIATFGEKFPKEGWLQPLAASFFAELKTILSESASPPITPQTAETSPKSVLRISDSEILPLSRQDETDNGIASGSENPGASLGATRRERSNSLSEGAPSDFGHRDVRKFKRSKSVGDLSAQMAPAKPPRLVETENPRSALEDQAATVTNNIAARVNSPLPRVLVKNDINEFINQTLTQIDSMDDKQHHSINGSTVSAGFFGKVLKKDFFTQLETSASTLLSGKEYITATDFMQDLKVQTFDKMTALHAAKGPVENDIPRVFLKMISDLKDHFLPAQSQNVHRGFRSLIGSSTQLSLRSFPGRAIRHFFDKPPTNR